MQILLHSLKMENLHAASSSSGLKTSVLVRRILIQNDTFTVNWNFEKSEINQFFFSIAQLKTVKESMRILNVDLKGDFSFLLLMSDFSQ